MYVSSLRCFSFLNFWAEAIKKESEQMLKCDREGMMNGIELSK